MNRVNNFGSQSLSSPPGCNFRRKSILGIRYKDISVPLRNLTACAVAFVVVNCCVFVFHMLLMVLTPSNLTLPVSPSLFFFSNPSPSYYYQCGQSADSRSTLDLSLEILTLPAQYAISNEEAGKTAKICHTNSVSKYSGTLSQLKDRGSRPVKTSKTFVQSCVVVPKKKGVTVT